MHPGTLKYLFVKQIATSVVEDSLLSQTGAVLPHIDSISLFLRAKQLLTFLMTRDCRLDSQEHINSFNAMFMNIRLTCQKILPAV